MSENVIPEQKAIVLTSRQVKALNALLRGGSAANAAKLARISERQLYRWLREPDFAAALKEAQQTRMEATVRALANAGADAVQVLYEIMSNPLARRDDAVRVRAAIGILTVALRWQEMQDMERRLRALEAAVVAKGGG